MTNKEMEEIFKKIKEILFEVMNEFERETKTGTFGADKSDIAGKYTEELAALLHTATQSAIRKTEKRMIMGVDRCIKCKKIMTLMGGLPYDFRTSDTDFLIYSCFNLKCKRYGLLTSVSYIKNHSSQKE